MVLAVFKESVYGQSAHGVSETFTGEPSSNEPSLSRLYKIEADNKRLVAQLFANNEVTKAKQAEAAAEVAKVRAEKEAAIAKKEIQIMELRMKLMIAEADPKQKIIHTESRAFEADSDDDASQTIVNGSKSNWLLAYEADDKVCLQISELFPEMREIRTIRFLDRWISVLRLFKRQRVAYLKRKLCNAKIRKVVKKMWIETQASEADDFIYLPELEEKSFREKQVKHYISKAHRNGLFPLLALF